MPDNVPPLVATQMLRDQGLEVRRLAQHGCDHMAGMGVRLTAWLGAPPSAGGVER